MRRGGFTLIELLVALILFQVVALGVLGHVHRSTAELGRAAALERALWLAEGLLDSLGSVTHPVPGSAARTGASASWDTIGDRLAVVVVSLPGRDTIRLDVPARH